MSSSRTQTWSDLSIGKICVFISSQISAQLTTDGSISSGLDVLWQGHIYLGFWSGHGCGTALAVVGTPTSSSLTITAPSSGGSAYAHHQWVFN